MRVPFSLLAASAVFLLTACAAAPARDDAAPPAPATEKKQEKKPAKTQKPKEKKKPGLAAALVTKAAKKKKVTSKKDGGTAVQAKCVERPVSDCILKGNVPSCAVPARTNAPFTRITCIHNKANDKYACVLGNRIEAGCESIQ